MLGGRYKGIGRVGKENREYKPIIKLIKRQFAAKINPAYNYINLKILYIVD